MSEQEIPPWLKEQLTRFDQLQQNLQAILVQKQQVEVELNEIERATTELKKMEPSGTVYKSTGSLLIRANKDDLLRELEERRELANTRQMVLSKQESRIRENVKELQTRLNEAIKGRAEQPSES